jgi:glutathione synthase/RimK-type ligase-like ATP-grasp enzyme
VEGAEGGLRVVLATAADEPDVTPSDELYAEALRRRGVEVVGASWDGRQESFAQASAVVLRSTWGYYRKLDAFRAWTERIAQSTRLFNAIGLVRWNFEKTYVGELARAGIAVPQSHFTACTGAAIDEVFAQTGWPRAVVKPLIGASGYGVELVDRADAATAASRIAEASPAARTLGVVVQEFLPDIAQGEISLVYFDNIFSHAIRKVPKSGEFRVNSRYGASRALDRPSLHIQEQGAKALRQLPEMPLYARVDGVVRDGALVVLEMEILEPALFMEFDPASAERFAEATLQRLGTSQAA